MAWAAFQKPNWTRVAGPQKMVQYFPAGVSGTPTGNLTFTAGQVRTVTLTAAFAWKGNGMIEVWAPMGAGSGYATAATGGVTIENAWLQGPGSGSYAGGNHPLILLQISSGAAFTTAATGFDLIAMES